MRVILHDRDNRFTPIIPGAYRRLVRVKNRRALRRLAYRVAAETGVWICAHFANSRAVEIPMRGPLPQRNDARQSIDERIWWAKPVEYR